MRHLRSILYALVLAPAIWVLCAVGFTGDLVGRARDTSGSIETLSGLLLLLLAGAAYAILVFSPVSPAGPLLTGLIYLGIGLWVLAAPASYAAAWPAGVAKDGFDLSLPGYGLALVLAVPMIGTALSARRWERYEPPVLPLIGALGRASGSARAHGETVAAAQTAVLHTTSAPGSRPTSVPRPAMSQTAQFAAPSAPASAPISGPAPASGPSAPDSRPGSAGSTSRTGQTAAVSGSDTEATTLLPAADDDEATTLLKLPAMNNGDEATTVLKLPVSDDRDGETTVLRLPASDESGDATSALRQTSDDGDATSVLRMPARDDGDGDGETTVLKLPTTDDSGDATSVLRQTSDDGDGETTVLKLPTTDDSGDATTVLKLPTGGSDDDATSLLSAPAEAASARDSASDATAPAAKPASSASAVSDGEVTTVLGAPADDESNPALKSGADDAATKLASDEEAATPLSALPAEAAPPSRMDEDENERTQLIRIVGAPDDTSSQEPATDDPRGATDAAEDETAVVETGAKDREDETADVHSEPVTQNVIAEPTTRDIHGQDQTVGSETVDIHGNEPTANVAADAERPGEDQTVDIRADDEPSQDVHGEDQTVDVRAEDEPSQDVHGEDQTVDIRADDEPSQDVHGEDQTVDVGSETEDIRGDDVTVNVARSSGEDKTVDIGAEPATQDIRRHGDEQPSGQGERPGEDETRDFLVGEQTVDAADVRGARQTEDVRGEMVTKEVGNRTVSAGAETVDVHGERTVLLPPVGERPTSDLGRKTREFGPGEKTVVIARDPGEQTQVIRLAGAGGVYPPPGETTREVNASVEGPGERTQVIRMPQPDEPVVPPSIVGAERPDPGADPTTRLTPLPDDADVAREQPAKPAPRPMTVMDMERPADEAQDDTRPITVPTQRKSPEG